MIKELLKMTVGFWNETVQELVQSLQKAYPGSSGNTAQSVGSLNVRPVEISARGLRIRIWMPPYYDYIDKGVGGAVNNKNRGFRYRYTNKKPPISAIRKFMLNRGIVGRNFRSIKRSSGRNRNKAIGNELNSIAYAIAHKIWRDGLIATHFYSNVINDAKIAAFERLVIEQYGDLIIDILDDA